MPVPNLVPPAQDTPIGYSPNSFGASLSSIFPLTPGAASTQAQIQAALAVAGQGLARIDVFPTPAQIATIATVPLSIIAAPLAGKIIVPMLWSMTKTVSAIGALNTIISIEWDDASWAGFPLMSTINADTAAARDGQFIAFPWQVGLTNFNTGVRTAVGKGLRLIGSADPGNFPATQITMKISMFVYVFTP